MTHEEQNGLVEAPQESVGNIIPDAWCSGSAFVFADGVLHVRKDGSGYIAVDEDKFSCEDDRYEGPDGPEGSVHWITRFPPGEMTALRDFLNRTALSQPEEQNTNDALREKFRTMMLKQSTTGSRDTYSDGFRNGLAWAIGELDRAALSQPEAQAVPEGLKKAIAFVRKRLDDYVAEHGSYDGETGVTEFPGNGDEYVCELEEIIEGLEALAASPATGGA